MTTQLHSKIIGSGRPLLILHGFLGMSDNWKTLGNKYAENDFEVHLIDQRNHGRSFWSSDFNYEVLAEDIKNYVQYHGLPKTAILGHSMGGKTVMQFACNFSQLVEKILVADIAPKYYPPHHHDILNALSELYLENIGSRGEADTELAKNLTDIGIRQFLLKNLYWIEKGKLGFRCNLEVLSERMEEIGENIGHTDLYHGPALFLRGDRSEYISNSDLPEIKRHFPEASLDTVQNAGHWLHADNPAEFFKKSLSFLKS
ncbi:MAG: alpha/beta fold hydrolase [Flavobacteriaceae bacterium]